MNKRGKFIALMALIAVIVTSVLALCSCDGLFGENGIFGGGGGGGNNNGKAKLTAEYDSRYTVYVGDSLDTVKQHLTVTYTHKDGGTQTVSDFDLTGTIAEGECTLTVSYEGLTATVKVTVIVNTNPLNLQFSLSQDGESYALGYVPQEVSELVIPESYKGKPVTSINSNAFRFGSGSITSITIPASINIIDSMCSTVETVYYDGTIADWCSIQFKGGENITNPMASASNFYIKSNGEYAKLTSVVIPDGVERIGGYQFYGFADITSVSISDSVTSIGNYAFYNCENITSVTISNSVTGIGDYAFYNCENITTLTIGNKVEKIGERAFYNSKSLTSLAIPDSVTKLGYAAFYNCINLTSLTLGNSITSIDESTFYNCSSLTSVTIPDSVEVIRPYAFGNGALTSLTIGNGVKHMYEFAFDKCTALESLYYNGTIADWCGIAFEEYTTGWNVRNPMYYASKFYLKNGDDEGYSQPTDLVIPDGVTKIGACQFYGLGALNSVTIPNSVLTVGTSAFSGCTFTTSATIPYVAVSQITAPAMVITNGTEIRAEAFKDRKTITSITLPSSLTSISWNAFYGCTALTSIEIPENVTSIDYNAFYGCTKLQSVTLNSKLTSIAKGVFYNCDAIESVYYNGTLSDWCGITFDRYDSSPVLLGGKFYIKDTDSEEYTELTELVIPQDVTSIGAYIFRNFSVTSIEFHDKVKEIGDYSFSNCQAITSFDLPQSLKRIGVSAFSGCKGITSLVIPDSITDIEAGAFGGCKGITSLVIPDSVTVIGESAFANCSNLASVSIPDTIERVGSYAFDGLASSAYTVEKMFGVNVKYIGNDNNPHLVLLKVPTGFNSSSFVIPDGTRIIIDRAFETYVSVRTLTIPTSVKYLGQYAFSYILQTINYDGTIEQWCDISVGSAIFPNTNYTNHFCIKNADNGNYTEVTKLVIPEGVTSIGQFQFAFFNNVESVTLPESLTYIGEKAFSECKAMTAVNICDNVTEIGTSAFERCSALETVAMGNGVQIIGDYAFRYCSNLTSMQAPESLISLGVGVFNSCGADMFNSYENASYWGNDNNPYWILVDATDSTTVIHEDTKVIAAHAFAGTTVRSVVIPDSVESIGESAFQNCKYLTSITIGSGVKYVGKNAFYMSQKITGIYYNGTIGDWCRIELNDVPFENNNTNRFYLKNSDGDGYTEVTEIVIPDDVESIAAERFYAFNCVKKITIGKNVTSIGKYAFYHCKKVFYVYFEGTVEEWKAIEKNSWIYTEMGITKVTCSDGTANLY